MASMCNVRENVSPGAAHREARWKEFRAFANLLGRNSPAYHVLCTDDVSRSDINGSCQMSPLVAQP